MSELDEGSVWIVIPAFNEGAVIGDVARSVLERYSNVVVVDDGSKDETWRIARDAGAAVVRHPINLGQGAALQTGVEYAVLRGADLIVTFDGDGQHQVDDIATMIREIQRTNSDVALGSRFLGRTVGLPWARRLVLKAAVVFTWVTTGLKLTDAHNGLRVLSRNAVKKLEMYQDGMAHASEIISNIASNHLRFVEVPVTIVYTEHSLRKGQKLSNLFSIIGEILSGGMRK